MDVDCQCKSNIISIEEVESKLKTTKPFSKRLNIQLGTEEKLVKLVAASDGLQLGENQPRIHRHFANTLFNINERWNF